MHEDPDPPDDPAEDMAVYERVGEHYYDKMYDARGRDVKECYEDACSNFMAAIKLAEELGRHEDWLRLRARLDHIMAVYNSQFRPLF